MLSSETNFNISISYLLHFPLIRTRSFSRNFNFSYLLFQSNFLLLFSTWLLFYFSSIFFHIAVVLEEPEFTEIIENVTVPAGRNVRLACSVKNLGTYKVSIIKHFYSIHIFLFLFVLPWRLLRGHFAYASHTVAEIEPVTVCDAYAKFETNYIHASKGVSFAVRINKTQNASSTWRVKCWRVKCCRGAYLRQSLWGKKWQIRCSNIICIRPKFISVQ